MLFKTVIIIKIQYTLKQNFISSIFFYFVELENETDFLELNIEWSSLDFRENVSTLADRDEIYYRKPITFTKSGPQVVGKSFCIQKQNTLLSRNTY